MAAIDVRERATAALEVLALHRSRRLLAEHGGENPQQGLWTERFRDDGDDPPLGRQFIEAEIETGAREHKDRQVASLGKIAHPLHQAQPIQTRHVAIGHEHIRLGIANGLPAILAVHGDTDFVTGVLQFLLSRTDRQDVVVTEQHTLRHDLLQCAV